MRELCNSGSSPSEIKTGTPHQPGQSAGVLPRTWSGPNRAPLNLIQRALHARQLTLDLFDVRAQVFDVRAHPALLGAYAVDVRAHPALLGAYAVDVRAYAVDVRTHLALNAVHPPKCH